VAAVFNRQAYLFQVLGMAVENRRHIFGHAISGNALNKTIRLKLRQHAALAMARVVIALQTTFVAPPSPARMLSPIDIAGWFLQKIRKIRLTSQPLCYFGWVVLQLRPTRGGG
jgi:hypothetical protein